MTEPTPQKGLIGRVREGLKELQGIMSPPINYSDFIYRMKRDGLHKVDISVAYDVLKCTIPACGIKFETETGLQLETNFRGYDKTFPWKGRFQYDHDPQGINEQVYAVALIQKEALNEILNIAEQLQKNGLEVTIHGQDIQRARDSLVKCVTVTKMLQGYGAIF